MNTEDFEVRAWAEIDLDALAFNFKQVKGLVAPETRVMAVVKANAYGHGAVMCAKTLLSAGADYLAVATLEEALELRQAEISAPILLLGHTADREAEMLVHYGITPSVYTLEFARAMSAAAVRLQKQAKIHVKINTGMERIGFEAEDTEAMLTVCRLPGLVAEGLFTHLACADAEDSSGVHKQYQRFVRAADKLKAAGVAIPIRHILNSAGIFDFPAYQLDMVRPGIVLYGYYPSAFINQQLAVLRPVLSLKARVVHLHTVPTGAGVGYGWSYSAPAPISVATVPFGYADGYHRLLSNRAYMLVGDVRVPVIGKICMDQCMIDVTSVHTIHVGDEITIIGGGENAITAEELATLSDTISYEILCAIGRRIPRLYIKDSSVAHVLNGFA